MPLTLAVGCINLSQGHKTPVNPCPAPGVGEGVQARQCPLEGLRVPILRGLTQLRLGRGGANEENESPQGAIHSLC